MRIDHLAVVAGDLAEGAAWVEARLGCKLRGGGRHARFGTHNRLIGLGPGEYLEVIAPDPEAPVPAEPRWFDLSSPVAAPQLGNWIVEVEDIEAALATAPVGAGRAIDMGRDGLTWKIAVPEDGSLPMQAGFPTLIEWQSGRHPSERLPDDGLRLAALEIHHPEAVWIEGLVSVRLSDHRVRFVNDPKPSLRARITTPAGEVWLG